MRCASDDDPLSAFSAENKSCFDHAHDGEPFCLPEHISWNCFLRHLLKLGNDRGTTIHSVLLGSIRHHHCKRQHRENKKQFLHRDTSASPMLIATGILTQSEMRGGGAGHKKGNGN